MPSGVHASRCWSCPAMPTNGSPSQTSSLPGASPTRMILASFGPTPRTTRRACWSGVRIPPPFVYPLVYLTVGQSILVLVFVFVVAPLGLHLPLFPRCRRRLLLFLFLLLGLVLVLLGLGRLRLQLLLLRLLLVLFLIFLCLLCLRPRIRRRLGYRPHLACRPRPALLRLVSLGQLADPDKVMVLFPEVHPDAVPPLARVAVALLGDGQAHLRALRRLHPLLVVVGDRHPGALEHPHQPSWPTFRAMPGLLPLATPVVLGADREPLPEGGTLELLGLDHPDDRRIHERPGVGRVLAPLPALDLLDLHLHAHRGHHPNRLLGLPEETACHWSPHLSSSLTLGCVLVIVVARLLVLVVLGSPLDRKSTRLNSSHLGISYAVFCLK